MASINRRTTSKGESRWDVRHRAPDGRERTRTFRTRRDAARFANTTEADKARGSWVDPRDAALTLREVSERWLESNPGKRPSTLKTDESQLRVHIYPTLGQRRIGAISRAEIQGLVNQWGRSMKPRSVRRCFGVLRAVYTFAETSDWIAKSPCRQIKLPTVTGTRKTVLSPDDVAAIADAMPIEHSPMVWVAAMAGLRWGEVAALRISSLDLLRSTLEVTETLTRKSDARFGAPKSEAGRRTITMPAALNELLAQHVQRQGLTGAKREALLFDVATGGPLDYANWRRRVWNPACLRSGLAQMVHGPDTRKKRYEGPVFHDLRRANATSLVASRVDLKTAQTRLGHSDPRLTLAVYAQATDEGDKVAAEALDLWFRVPRAG